MGWEGVVKLQFGGGKVWALAAQQLDPLVKNRALKYWGGGGGARLGEEGYRASERIHAQRASLLGIPNAAGTQWGVVDGVQRQGCCKRGGAQVGGEALNQRDATWAGANDGDGGHNNQTSIFRLFCLVE